jgi:DnaJ-class molecular chaperone
VSDEPLPPQDTAALLGTFRDLFGEFFGAKGRGGDRKVTLRLSPVEAAVGCTKRVVYMRVTACPRCVDHGPCDACQGKGQVVFHRGELTVTKPCAACAGRARFVDACGACAGGDVEAEESLSVSVPAGTNHGVFLRVPEKGDAPVGLAPGHLYVELDVSSCVSADDVEPGAHPFRDARPRPAALPVPAAPRSFPVRAVLVAALLFGAALWALLR